MMKENYNTPNSGCCGRPFPTAPENKCNYNDCCMNEYAYKQKACIREKQPDCEAQAVIPSITVETVDGITNLANCLVHVTSTNTTYYVDDKHRIMITWAGPVNISGYDMVNNPRHFKNQIVSDIDQKIAVLYDNNGRGFTFAIDQDADFVQAVNAKLDEMAEDGTLTSLIGAYCEPRLTQQDNKIDAMERQVNSLDTLVSNYLDLDMDRIRKETYKDYQKVTLPTEFTEDFFNQLNIIGNKYGNYTANYNIETVKNMNSTHTWYVAPDGVNTNSGADADHPWRSLSSNVQANISEGDTVVFKAGFYPRDRGFVDMNPITKSMNIICPDGKAYLTMYDASWSWTQYGNNTWYVNRTAVTHVYDITRYEEEIFTELTQLNSAAAVDETPNSWYTDGTVVYVHMYDNQKPDITNLNIQLQLNYPRINIEPTTDAKIYIENVSVLSSNYSGVRCSNSNEHDVQVTLKNVGIFNVGRYYDGLQNLGCKTFCDNVHVANVKKDGFNYHAQNEMQAYGIELNCRANNCGINHPEGTSNSNNGTTCHDSCKAIRINGIYNYTSGDVVVDINNSVGACYGCVIADSTETKRDVFTSDSSKIYLYNCFMLGSDSTYNLYAGSGSTIYYSNSKFVTTGGTGSIINLNI